MPFVAARGAVRVARDQMVEITLHLKRRAPLPRPGQARARTIAPERFAEAHGARDADIAAVTAFAHDHDLRVTFVDRAARTMACRGAARAMERAFGVELVHVGAGSSRHRGHHAAVSVPRAVAAAIDGVLGLDDRPVATPHVRHYTAAHRRRRRLPPFLAHYLPRRIAELYCFPAAFDGRGQSIGIVELDGGFRRADLEASFRRMRLSPPTVVVRRINGAANRPIGRPTGADSEVMLDLVMAGAAAPGATLVAYFAPWDERGFVDAVKAAVHDRVNRVSVLSISWGNAEPYWSRQAMRLMNAALHDAAALGITVCASSGDLGSSSGVQSGLAVNFPASSPYALACGATRAIARGRRITSETVWNDLDLGFGATGGGVSAVFARPRYQSGVNVPRRTAGAGRGVPDLAANGDPETGYLLRVDRRWVRLGGTSASAPLWAGLIARLNQALGRRVGHVHAELYRLRGSRAFRAITRGDNGAFRAGRIWNACTGLGSPRADRLFRALAGRG